MFKQLCFRLLLLASAIATSLSAAAYSFESAGIYYNITGNNTVEVTYSDRDNNTYSGSISVPETVTNNGTEYSVTKIGEYAFQGSAVTSVSMPECITSIGQYACNECGSLETVVLPTNLDDFSGWCIFRNCRNLKNIAIPENVTEIPNGTFINCSSLAAITIPHGVSEIGSNAFSSCRLLEEINIPNGVEAIKVSAFVCCDKLENISLPVSVKQIEVHAFAGSGLKTIKLFGEVTSIGEYAFADCFSLTDFYCYSDNSPQTAENVFVKVDLNKVNLHVPCNRKDAYTGADYWRDFGHIFTTDEVKQDGLWYRLDDNTWEAAIINNPDGNSRIIYEGDIVIPTDIGFSHANYDVTSIGVRAFEYSNITSVSIPKSVVSIGTSAFLGCPFTSIDIPNTVTAIGAYTFAGCPNLKSVILPNSLETIEGGLFSNCRNLESVKIPNTVTSIRHSAFQYCCNLESIIIPSSVNSIGISAFSECKALKDIYCQAVNVPETHSSAFNNSPIENMTLYVPGESMNAYKTTAPWSGFGKFQALTTGIEKTETAAKPMITTADGQIAVSGLSGNASIQVLSLDGKLLDSTNATDGIATLNAQPGEVVIVKVGTESYKVVVR